MALMKMPCAVGSGGGKGDIDVVSLPDGSSMEASWDYDAKYIWIFSKTVSNGNYNIQVFDVINQTITNTEMNLPNYCGKNVDVPISQIVPSWGYSVVNITPRSFKIVHSSASFTDIDYFVTDEAPRQYQ